MKGEEAFHTVEWAVELKKRREKIFGFNHVQRDEYWKKSFKNSNYYQRTVKEIFFKIIEEQLIQTDTNVSLALSGGLDSSSVVCVANKINKEQGMGLSKQSWFLFKKIKEIDTILEIKNRPEIFESHPELVFQVMKGGAIETKKNTQEGLKERIDILKENGFDKKFIEKFINKKNSFYKNDDFIDSCSLFWSAKRVVKNNEIQIPNKIIRDVKGIIMQMKI